MEPTVEQIVASLELTPHPEGGFFRETWRSPVQLDKAALPAPFSGPRAAGTSILYLLPQGTFSALHRIASDEIWHFHAGSALAVDVLHADGGHRRAVCGMALGSGQQPQCVVPAGAWFGASVVGTGPYALVGCTVSPGFDFADFEMGVAAELVLRYPAHRELIARLTRG